MNPPLYIALRFISHRKRSLVLSLAGVVFGVAIFICTQAQTQGFARQFIKSTLGSSGAMQMGARFHKTEQQLLVPPKNSTEANRRRYLVGIPDANEIMRVSRQFSDVVACSPVLRGTLTARAGFETATVDLYGIDPPLHVQTTDIATQLVNGGMQTFRENPNSLIIGSKLSQLLGVIEGDAMQLLSPSGEYSRFTVAGIARSGVGSVDATRVYCHARVAQRILRKPYAASLIIYKLRDPARAPTLAEHFERLFQHDTTSWQSREEANLQLFLTLQISAAITVSLIILLAGFGIFNVLTLSVLSKVREIAILRSMGYRQRDISAIFLWQGGLIATVGSIIGCLAGAVMTWGISLVPIRMRGLLFANHFLVAWNWHHYASAVVLATIASFIASYVPARRAAELPPVATLRGSSV